MVWLKTFLARVGALFHKRRFDKELEEELGFHLEMEAGQNLRNGMSPTEAQRAARLSLGNPELVKEDCRDARNFAWLAAFLQDLRFATRMLRRNPGFTAVVALTLALGVGSVTTIFSAMNAALLQPLPFKDPDRLVWLRKFKLDQPEQWRHLTMSATLRWTEESQSFEGIAAAVGYSEDATISGEGQAESVALRQVSSGLFSLLGVEPQLGRTFLPEDVRNETGDVTMISHRLWLRRYGGDPEICGKTIRVNRNSQALTIIGVMPPDFWIFPWVDDVDLWFVQRLGSNKSRRFSSLARLKPGVHLSQAQAEAEIFAQQLAQEEGGDGEDWGVEARLLNEVFFPSGVRYSCWPSVR